LYLPDFPTTANIFINIYNRISVSSETAYFWKKAAMQLTTFENDITLFQCGVSLSCREHKTMEW